MQEEVYRHSQHTRTLCWKDKVSQMRGAQSATTHHSISSENFEKELANVEANFKYPGSNAKSSEFLFFLERG